jgi:hypothetical protein
MICQTEIMLENLVVWKTFPYFFSSIQRLIQIVLSFHVNNKQLLSTHCGTPPMHNATKT